MQNTIHRNTTKLLFVAKLDTNATNAGEVYTAWKDSSGWHIYDTYTGAKYLTPVATLRILAAEIIEQTAEPLSLEFRLQH